MLIEYIPFTKRHNQRIISKALESSREEIRSTWENDRPCRSIRYLVFKDEFQRELLLLIVVPASVLAIITVLFIAPFILFHLGLSFHPASERSHEYPILIGGVAGLIYFFGAFSLLIKHACKHFECRKGGKPTMKTLILFQFLMSSPSVIVLPIGFYLNDAIITSIGMVFLFPIASIVIQFAIGAAFGYSGASLLQIKLWMSGHFYPATKLYYAFRFLKSIEQAKTSNFSASRKASTHLMRASEYYAYRCNFQSKLTINGAAHQYNSKLSARMYKYALSAKYLTRNSLQPLLNSIEGDLILISNQMVPEIEDEAIVNMPKRRRIDMAYSVLYLFSGILILVLYSRLRSSIPAELNDIYNYASLGLGILLIARGVFGKISKFHDFLDSIKEIMGKIEGLSQLASKSK